MSDKRLKSIDGLRGVSCLAVVCFHFFNETFRNTSSLVCNPLSMFLFDGPMAVALFFIISGEALSASFISKWDKASIFRPAIKRWPRLSIPVFFSGFLVFIISKMGWVYNKQASAIVNRTDWLGMFLSHPPSFSDVLDFSFISVFKDIAAAKDFPQNFLNPFLWTMHFELLGSFFIFAIFILLYKKWFYVVPVFIFITFWMSSPYALAFLSCFLVGFLMYVARSRGLFGKLQNLNYSNLYTLLFVVALFVLETHYKNLYSSLWFLFLKSSLVALVFLSNKNVCRFLDSKMIQFLGKISFPLFLVQFPILISFVSYLIIKYYAATPTPLMACLIAGVGVVVSVVLAMAMYPVELITQKICNDLYKRVRVVFDV